MKTMGEKTHLNMLWISKNGIVYRLKYDCGASALFSTPDTINLKWAFVSVGKLGFLSKLVSTKDRFAWIKNLSCLPGFWCFGNFFSLSRFVIPFWVYFRFFPVLFFPTYKIHLTINKVNNNKKRARIAMGRTTKKQFNGSKE